VDKKADNKLKIERRTARQKADLVLEIIKGQRTIVDVARESDLKQSEILTISLDLQEMTLSASIRREVAVSS